MSIDHLMLSLPEGCELWRIDTSFVGKHCILITPTNKKFQLSHKATDIIAQLVDQDKSVRDIASTLSDQWKTDVSADDILAIIESAHWPKDLVRKFYPWETDSTLAQSVEEREESSLFSRYYFRFTLLPAPTVKRIADRLVGMYKLKRALPAMLVIAIVHYYVYSYLSLNNSVLKASLLSPGEYVTAFTLMFLTVLIHEFGHASATASYGVKPGAIGCGLYLIYPSLYTELGFAWLLPRMKRAIIDVGGFYFQLIATLPLYLAFLLTGSKIFIIVILAVDALIVFSLIPFFKFDGYWILSDLLGVPNLKKRAIELVKTPLTAVSKKYVTTESGLTMKRGMAITVLTYGIFFLIFQIAFAALIINSGVGIVLKAPVEIFTHLSAAVADLRAAEVAGMAYQVIKAFMQVVLALSLILILRSYAILCLKFGRYALGWAYQKSAANGRSRQISTEGGESR